MYQSFANYTNIALNAIQFSDDSSAIINKKQEILESLLNTHNLKFDSVLFFGFSPWLLSYNGCENIFATCLTDQVKEYLNSLGKKITYIDENELLDGNQDFDCVVAIDEFTTFAKTETDQREKVDFICDLTNKLLITTVRDYKNQDFKDKDFGLPNALKQGQQAKLFLEYYNYDYQDRYAWLAQVYELTGSEMLYHGTFDRRAMFFKQLAKFSLDAGASKFLVHKNLMYKSLLRRNYEYLIGIEFKE